MPEPITTAVEKVRPPEMTAVERADLAMQRRAAQLAKATGLLPKPLQGKPAEVYMILVKADGLGIPDGEALANLYPIEGRLVPSAQLQAALVRRAGHKLVVVEQDREKCIVRARRREDPAEDTLTITYSEADARDAGLLDQWVENKVADGKWPDGNTRYRTERYVIGTTDTPPDWAKKEIAAGNVKSRENWWRYRQDMLRARAISQACRSLFSDCLLGIGGHIDWSDDDVERAETRAQAQARQEPEPEIEDQEEELDELTPLEDEPERTDGDE